MSWTRACSREWVSASALPRRGFQGSGSGTLARPSSVPTFRSASSRPLEPGDSGHESKMVGVVALLVAAFPEAAGVTLLDWLGHRERQPGEGLFERGEEPGLHPTEIGRAHV